MTDPSREAFDRWYATSRLYAEKDVASEVWQAAVAWATARRDQQEAQSSTASALIDAWIADKGRKIPWAKAVQITAIVTKQSDAERDRLLHMGDEDGACEMCGRSDEQSTEKP